MPYEDKNLSIEPTPVTWTSAGGAKTVLHDGLFATADAAAVVEAANYFNAAAPRIPDGGYVMIEAVVGIPAAIKFKQYLLSRAGAVVTATLLTTTAG